TTYYYDQGNRKTLEENGVYDKLTWLYDDNAYGRLKSRKDMDGREFRYSYNDFGQVLYERLAINGEEVFVGATETTTYPIFSYLYYDNG
ncbi:hypothetical protein ABTE60_20830, partial [Acinetobacter baumannii]